MALSFIVGNEVFVHNQMGPANIAKAFNATPINSLIRYHPPGTTGNLLTRAGPSAYTILIAVKVVSDTLQNTWSEFFEMAHDWNDVAVTITAPDGREFTRCSLDPDSMRVTIQPRGTGCGGGECFMEFQASFTCDTGTQDP